MLFHSPLASSSCPFMVKWKQSWVKNVMSILPLFPWEKRKRYNNVDFIPGECLWKKNINPLKTYIDRSHLFSFKIHGETMHMSCVQNNQQRVYRHMEAGVLHMSECGCVCVCVCVRACVYCWHVLREDRTGSVPAGGGGRSSSGRAEERPQSRPGRSDCCRGAALDASRSQRMVKSNVLKLSSTRSSTLATGYCTFFFGWQQLKLEQS